MGIGLEWKLIKLNTFLYRHRYHIDIGENSLIYGRQEFTGGGKIKIGNNTRISRWCVFREYGGCITIGDNCSVNSFCHFSGNGGITIGDNVLIATQCVLITANHNFDEITKPISSQGESRAPIVIEDDCWLGAGVKVLMGVTIGRGSVIGAGSVVTKDVPPYSVVVGVPGKVMKSRAEDVIDLSKWGGVIVMLKKWREPRGISETAHLRKSCLVN